MVSAVVFRWVSCWALARIDSDILTSVLNVVLMADSSIGFGIIAGVGMFFVRNGVRMTGGGRSGPMVAFPGVYWKDVSFLSGSGVNAFA